MNVFEYTGKSNEKQAKKFNKLTLQVITTTEKWKKYKGRWRSGRKKRGTVQWTA